MSVRLISARQRWVSLASLNTCMRGRQVQHQGQRHYTRKNSFPFVFSVSTPLILRLDCCLCHDYHYCATGDATAFRRMGSPTTRPLTVGRSPNMFPLLLPISLIQTGLVTSPRFDGSAAEVWCLRRRTASPRQPQVDPFICPGSPLTLARYPGQGTMGGAPGFHESRIVNTRAYQLLSELSLGQWQSTEHE
jgi:hypothetical protein